jgi:hypothetical protein
VHCAEYPQAIIWISAANGILGIGSA